MEKGKSEMEISGVGGVGHSALEYAAIPAFQDNYIWVISNGRDAVVIDPGDEAPVRAYLRERRLRLSAILLTHHHGDHTGGALALGEGQIFRSTARPPRAFPA